MLFSFVEIECLEQRNNQ